MRMHSAGKHRSGLGAIAFNNYARSHTLAGICYQKTQEATKRTMWLSMAAYNVDQDMKAQLLAAQSTLSKAGHSAPNCLGCALTLPVLYCSSTDSYCSTPELNECN